MSGGEVCHGTDCSIILLLEGSLEFFHKVAACAQINAVFFHFSHETVSTCFQGDPHITERKLIIFVSFELFFEVSGCDLVCFQGRPGSQYPVFFFGESTVRNEDPCYKHHDGDEEKEKSHPPQKEPVISD